MSPLDGSYYGWGEHVSSGGILSYDDPPTVRTWAGELTEYPRPSMLVPKQDSPDAQV